MADAEVSSNGISKFVVNDVAVGTQAKRISEESYAKAWDKIASEKGVESYSSPPSNVVAVFSDKNILAKMVHDAFYKHYPIELSPDVIWITIMQGFALHVHQNAEKLRDKFVDFDGKKQLAISRPDFALGRKENDWAGVFPEFEQLIKENIGETTTDLITQDFSTTGPVEKITMQIVLMDVVESYFEYVIMCGCGIPSIQLTGTAEDWISIRERAEKLADFGLDWWTAELLPVLDKLVDAAKGEPDVEFFSSICNLYAGSGYRTPVTGWIQCFYPYLVDGQERSYRSMQNQEKESDKSPYKRNKWIAQWRKCYETGSQNDLEGGFGHMSGSGRGCGVGVDLENFPASISSVPFKLVDARTNTTHDLRFCAGLTSISQDEDSTVRCNAGWAVLNGSEPLRINTK